MTRLFIILALLAQAPKPLPTPKPAVTWKWDKYIGLLADNSTLGGRTVWSVECKDAKECFAFQAKDDGRVLFQIADGDGPAGVGGPCDLGNLVRAAKAHLDRDCHNYSEPGMMMLCDGSELSMLRDQSIRLKILRDEISRCEPKPEPGR